MDIGSNGPYPAGALSNFSPFRFELDGVTCASMEGFLQSVKFSDLDTQLRVCSLVGFKAKKAGRDEKWYLGQTLYWQGVEYKRDSEEYQDLLDRAYGALAQNESFRKALLDTGGEVLTHSMGKNNLSETVLTEDEFMSRLTYLREALRAE